MKIILAAGGTGGHFFPAVGLYETIRTTRKDYETIFFTSHRQRHFAHLLPKKTYYIKSIGFSRRNPLAIVIFLLYLLRNTVGALYVFLKEKPNAVVGFGGYVASAPILAALLLGIPYILHEQNSVPGKANRLFARKAEKVLTSLKTSKEYWPAKAQSKIVHTGIPLRKNVAPANSNKSVSNDKHLFTVLIIGGSQGAHIFVELVQNLLGELKSIRQKMLFIHLCAQSDIEFLENIYTEYDMPHECYGFHERMSDIYSRCTMAICRAGASTLYELAVWQIPAIIVPYPYAADNHQFINAQSIAYPEWYTVVEQHEGAPLAIASHIIRMFDKHKIGSLTKPSAVEVCAHNAGEKIIGIIENDRKIIGVRR